MMEMIKLVEPSEEYAKEMLRLNIENAKRLGIPKLMITCNANNLASKKTILTNSGVFEKTVDGDGHQVMRFWIEV